MTTVPFKTKALYTYNSDFEDDLNFEVGQVIEITAIEDEQWYSGRYVDQDGTLKEGMFPRNFVGEAIADDPEEKEEETAEELEQPVAPVEQENETEAENEEDDAIEEPHKTTVSSIEETRPVGPSSTAKETTPIKKFTSKVQSFNTQSSIPSPSNAIDSPQLSKSSYKGAPSSYIPPSLGNKDKPAHSKPDYHSSYIPPKLGRSNTFKKENESTAPAPAPVVNSEEKTEETEQGPKLSLKERIALLQKQQQEEAEKQAALLKKKQEKKEAKKHQHEAQQHAPLASVPNAESEADAEEEELDDNESLASKVTVTHHDLVNAGGLGEVAEQQEDEVEQVSQQQTKELGQETQEAEAEAEDEDEQDDDDDEEEEVDEEEARRAALAARMAKLSGAAGGFGGFNPFGGIPRPVPTKTKRKDSAPKVEKEEEQEVRAAPVPMFLFVPGAAPQLPPQLQGKKKAVQPEDEEDINDDDEEKQKFEDPVAVAEATEAKRGVVASAPPIPVPTGTHAHFFEELKEEQPFEDDEAIQASKDEVYQDDETEEEPQEATAEEDHSASLANKLTYLDINSTSQSKSQPVSESAIEGDDESESSDQEDEDEHFTFSDHAKKQQDLERERSELENDIHQSAPHHITPLPPSAPPLPLLSDTNTGYESDDDQANNFTTSDVGGTPKRALPPPPAITSTSVPPPIPSTSVPPPLPPISIPSLPVSETLVSSAAKDDHLVSSPTSLRSHETAYSHQVLSELPPVPPSHHKAPPPPPAHSQTRSGVPPPLPEEENLHQHYKPAPIAPPSPTDSQFIAKPARKSATFSSTSASTASTSPLEDDIKYQVSSGWWLNENSLPPHLQNKIGRDLVYEVDINALKKRGGRQLVLKDYYILHQGNSQTILNVTYDPARPQETVSLKSEIIRSLDLSPSQLEHASAKYGVKVFQLASSLLNSSIKGPLIPYILSQINGVAPPVGLKSYGAVIYTNTNNSEVHQSAPFKAGDILAINKAKFQGHNKLRQKIVYDVGHSPEGPFAAVITEFDEEKRKFRVIEAEGGKVRHASYKPTDMKQGKIKVFRAIGREDIGW